MKINLKHKILRIFLLGLALSAAMQSFTIQDAVALQAGKSGRHSAKVPKTLTEQICHYIQVEDLQISGLEKGIVVVSFQLDQNNEIRQVISHSHNTSLDNYLKTSLEGKQIQIEDDQFAKGQTQFVKLRINIEK